ncbi:MAG: hypothetical protein M1816_005981 [Peltula sp. TS41687]|nr:MAG: hypothetical protein M1816_005981 [Peltula sp. TS41687]
MSPQLSATREVLEPYNDWPNDQGFIGDHDYRAPVELVVIGTIPPYAAGTLYRNGPGGYQIDTEGGSKVAMDHWFDGFSQVHRFQIIPPTTSSSSTRVLYNSRTTVDKLIEHIRKTGSRKAFSFGQKRDPCESYFKKIMTVFLPSRMIDFNVELNIGVTLSVDLPGFRSFQESDKQREKGHASGSNTLWSKTDAAVLKQLDPETLEPLGVAKQQVLHPELIGDFSAAHGKSDPKTGDFFNYNLEVGRQSTYRIFRVSASTGETEILAKITDAPGAYLHSFFLTPNHVVLCIWAGHYAYSGLKLLWEKNILDAMAPLDPSNPARWYVIDRQGKGVVASYESDPFFCFHTINAWEQPSPSDPQRIDIIADLCAYENCDVLKRFYYDNLLSTSPGSRAFAGTKGDSTRPYISRWRLEGVNQSSPTKATTQARRAQLEWTAPRPHSIELPTINPEYVSRPHRYVYGVNDHGRSSFFDGIVKFDTQTRTSLYWREQGQSPGEAIFIPDPDGTKEDDGVLLSVVLDGLKGKSYLLCLDARTMMEMGRARLESVVGFGFHGTHVSAAGRGRTVDF